MLQFISLPLKIELISDTNAQLIQNSITSYHKNRERTRKTKRERKKGKIIDHMTERKTRQNRVAETNTKRSGYRFRGRGRNVSKQQ